MEKYCLPEWDLDDLYADKDDPAIDADLSSAEKSALEFSELYQDKLSKLSGREFGIAINSYEDLSEALAKIMSFAQLLFAENSEDTDVATFYQNINERVISISSLSLFFELEINRLGDENISRFLKSTGVRIYKPWLDAVLIHKPYQLSHELERLIHEKSVTGHNAWSRLFDETLAELRFEIEGKQLTSSEVLSRMSDVEGQTRKDAAKAFGKGLRDNIRLFALITNTLTKDKEIEDRWRGLERSVTSRNLGNQVEDEVVDALVNAVRTAYPYLSHRYYKLKAAWMGVEFLNYWDRNAPLPEAVDAQIPWEEAKSTVLGSYYGFEPRLGEIAEGFFNNGWIDANPRPGKASGAFSHPTVPSVHPYILMSYHGKSRDVMTLAHELGHGVHQVLAAAQGHFLANTPLTLAETASVFGEMLTFQSLLAATEKGTSRKVLLASKVEDMLNTAVRQVAFYEFEEKLHEERRKGELDPNQLGEMWMSVQKDSLGPAFRYDDEYRYYWAYIPHFIHSPFYVYSYAFGDCLVNSLYDVFVQGHSGFRNKYIQMLQAGGTLRHTELLAPFGLDASDPTFWKRGLDMISGFVDELENSM